MSLIEALKWRYATKKMNGQAVPQDKVDQILEAARLAPTSSGLHPFKVIVITNPELKQTLLPHSYNQSQIIDCSHLLVFAAWDNYTEERINQVFEHNNNERGLPSSTTSDYQNMLISNYVPRTAEVNFQHAARQAYIGFGLALAEAALLKVDATPMEGFDNAQYDEILNLKEKGLRSVTLLPLGYRDETGDWLVNLKKVRQHKSDFIIEFK
ncbi:nitroreductase family protein [Pedobacter sp. Hv1]|uniref:nitroreductase family protein n=1 Tax=Pedobacter sp. Hv1 TaxID=1740090 RepID=UPI0006D8D60F|nr:nitroreductase family protein [Pedobacter sp. Hv1]KQC00428.1 nitroreductase [Pedobacter sp. Hv1]